MRKDIYGDNISYVTNEMSSIHPSEANLNEENRAKFVTDLAAVSRGKDGAKNPSKRYKALLKEAAPQYNEIMKNEAFYTCPKCGDDCEGDIDQDTNIIVRCDNCHIICDSVSAEQPDGYDISEWAYKIKGSPSRPLEFLPILLYVQFNGNVATLAGTSREICHQMSVEDFHNSFGGTMGYLSGYHLHTNMRACINAGIPYGNIPYNTAEELQDFRALKANIPMFVFNHLITHTALSKEAQSDRVTKNGDYWLPKDLRDRAYKYVDTEDKTYDTVYSEFLDISKNLLKANPKHTMVDKLLSLSQNVVQSYFKALGYKKEIYQRAMLEFRYKEVVMTAWNNNPKTFQHFTIEREAYPEIHKSWVQEQTKLLAITIREVVSS